MFIRSAFKQGMDRSRRILVYAIEANGNLLGRLGLHGRLGLLDESGATKYEMLCSSTWFVERCKEAPDSTTIMISRMLSASPLKPSWLGDSAIIQAIWARVLLMEVFSLS